MDSIKEKLGKQMAKWIDEYDLSYSQFNQICGYARKLRDLKPDNRLQKVHVLPTLEEIQKFMKIIENKGLKYELMIKILLYLGLRSFELINLKVIDVDFTQDREKIKILGKGNKERYVPIPKLLISQLKFYLKNEAKHNIYLFESRSGKMYDTSSIRYLFINARKEADISDTMHPHNLRHVLLTELATMNLSNQRLKLISGHVKSENLDIYTNMNIEVNRDDMNKNVMRFEGMF